MVQNRCLMTAELFRALAHPQRIRILELLRGRELCVCELMGSLRRPQAYVSQQLAVLRRAGLIVDRRQGTQVYYRLADPSLHELLARAAKLGEGLESKLPISV